MSATATLVDALAVDLSPTGPSEGDTVRYTATLQGTGDCDPTTVIYVDPFIFADDFETGNTSGWSLTFP